MGRREQVAAAAAVVLLGGCGLGTPAVGQPGQQAGQQPGQQAPAPPAPPVLAAPTPAATPAAGARPYATVLGRALGDRALGRAPAAAVVDLGSGRPVFAARSAEPRAPASVTKLFTAAAALSTLGPEHVFTTRVVSGGVAGRLVLVGGGDPLLSATSGEVDTGVPRTPLDRLARATVAAVRRLPAAQRPARVSVVVDDRLFGRPGVPPGWSSDLVTVGEVGPVGALSLDGARAAPDRPARVRDPGLAAGERFAARLTAAGLRAALAGRGTAPPTAASIAAVTSAPLSRFVEHTLDASDDDAAEVLARSVAVASGRPGTAAAAPPAVLAAVGALGVDVRGARLLDGSGLSRGNRVSAAQVVALLGRAAADPSRYGALLSGLPVAGATGTLAGRFDAPVDAAGRGIVRGKTGTLTGVSTLAGTTVGRDGRTYAFALLADGVPAGAAGTDVARGALDAVASTLTACGCR